MNEEIYIFLGEDFKSTSSSSIVELSDRELMDSLQGTLVGIDALSEVEDQVKGLLKEAEIDENASLCAGFARPTLERLEAGLDVITQLLLERVGHERVSALVKKTLELIALEKSDEE